MILGFDTETTGLDLFHAARPFFVSTCDSEGNQRYWEWSVDHRTREVIVPEGDLDEVREYIYSFDLLVAHNAKFDVHALRSIDHRYDDWPWEKTHDTAVTAHLLDTSQLKDLTSLVLKYLDHDISSHEAKLHKAVNQARAKCRNKASIEERGTWNTATAETPGLPSNKGESASHSDYWLPRRLWTKYKDVRDEYPDWESVLRTYALADTEVLIPLYDAMLLQVKERDEGGLLQARQEIVPVLATMERRGVTVNAKNLDKLSGQYSKQSEEYGKTCLGIAKARDYDLQLPKSGRNKSLDTFAFDVLQLPKMYGKKSKTGNPTLDKNAMQHYLDTLPDGDRLMFVKSLMKKRKRDTSISYIEGYKRFWKPTEHKGHYRLHPSLNPGGTEVTRRSSKQPNEQNVSKQKDEEGNSLRYGFGPAPGREWWSMDYENLELRIPAYGAGEQAMIDLFENPDEEPYFGSNHLLCAHILWPKEFEECLRKGESFKDKYKSTLYQWTKNGGFAVQYGAQEQSGTADRAYHQEGAQRKIQSRLGKINDISRFMLDHANRHGFVRTMPDREVDPEKGYPVVCPFTERGGVRPTVPLSYHVQGTAGWVTGKALVRCHRQIEEWNAVAGRIGYWIAMEVHDELVFDFPAGGRKNLPKVNRLRYLMELSGRDIGVPLKVDVSYHPKNWAEDLIHVN